MNDKSCKGYTIRPASPDDAGAVLAIYAPYVTDTCISFETEVPAFDAFRQRMCGIMAGSPYYVCECGGVVVGFAYASKYSERRAYRYSADLTVYVAPGHHGRGVGRLLYERLIADLRERGIYTVYACVTAENTASLKFHTALGFTECGRFHNIGYKHGRWLDVVWLEKPIREYDTPLR
jgi:phosphinothricin acetyltransferase